MNGLFMLLMNACAPGKYFSYPSDNPDWHPEGISAALMAHGVKAETTTDYSSDFDTVGSSDNYSEWSHTHKYEINYDLSGSSFWNAYGVRLLSVAMREEVTHITRHCEEDYGPDAEGVYQEGPQDPFESETCENGSSYEHETEVLGSLHFDYEYADQECTVSIGRFAPLNYSDPAVWRFREYPDDPSFSDVNTCEDLMSDEDAVGALDEIVFGMNTLIGPAFVSHLADYGVARPAFVERLRRGKEEK